MRLSRPSWAAIEVGVNLDFNSASIWYRFFSHSCFHFPLLVLWFPWPISVTSVALFVLQHSWSEWIFLFYLGQFILQFTIPFKPPSCHSIFSSEMTMSESWNSIFLILRRFSYRTRSSIMALKTSSGNFKIRSLWIVYSGISCLVIVFRGSSPCGSPGTFPSWCWRWRVFFWKSMSSYFIPIISLRRSASMISMSFLSQSSLSIFPMSDLAIYYLPTVFCSKYYMIFAFPCRVC